jgi:hypothetical protein
VCGTLSFRGSGQYSIRITTETGAVARTVIKLAHQVFGLETQLTVRRSVLHKTRNYLIEMPDQPGLEDALVRMGILAPGRGLLSGIRPSLVRNVCDRSAYLRGAFMAGGFVADPRGDFHLEIAVTGEGFAQDLVKLCSLVGVTARLNHRRGAFAIYLKSYDDIARLLKVMGASRTAAAVEGVRIMKSVKNDVNRTVNAEIANQRRATGAAFEQLDLIDRVERRPGFAALPPALREFCELRREYPEMSLAELGQQAKKKASKSAMYHRVLRLGQIDREFSED